jgi:hypothetical protein
VGLFGGHYVSSNLLGASLGWVLFILVIQVSIIDIARSILCHDADIAYAVGADYCGGKTDSLDAPDALHAFVAYCVFVTKKRFYP